MNALKTRCNKMSENKQWKKPGYFLCHVCFILFPCKQGTPPASQIRIEVRSHDLFQPFPRSELPTLEKIVLSVGTASLKAAIHDHQFNMRKHWNSATDTIAVIIAATNWNVLALYPGSWSNIIPTSSNHILGSGCMSFRLIGFDRSWFRHDMPCSRTC